jgi:hypothetical protein
MVRPRGSGLPTSGCFASPHHHSLSSLSLSLVPPGQLKLGFTSSKRLRCLAKTALRDAGQNGTIGCLAGWAHSFYPRLVFTRWVWTLPCAAPQFVSCMVTPFFFFSIPGDPGTGEPYYEKLYAFSGSWCWSMRTTVYEVRGRKRLNSKENIARQIGILPESIGLVGIKPKKTCGIITIKIKVQKQIKMEQRRIVVTVVTSQWSEILNSAH